jgi:predicted XRE-type DNA-binding protein
MAKRKVRRRRHQVKQSTGNVFADLGFPRADVELAKAQLAHRIAEVIDSRALTQRQAGEILGLDQPGVSHLMRGNLKRFSMDRLFRFLVVLGRDVEIVVKPRSRTRQASLRVTSTGRGRRSA